MYDARTHYNRSGIPVAIIRFHCRSCPPKYMLINTSGVRNSLYENAARSSCPLQLCFSLLQLFFYTFCIWAVFFIAKSLNLQLKCVRAFTTEPFGIASESGGRLMFSPEYKMHFEICYLKWLPSSCPRRISKKEFDYQNRCLHA